jgi:hypothetical protein
MIVVDTLLLVKDVVVWLNNSGEFVISVFGGSGDLETSEISVPFVLKIFCLISEAEMVTGANLVEVCADELVEEPLFVLSLPSLSSLPSLPLLLSESL